MDDIIIKIAGAFGGLLIIFAIIVGISDAESKPTKSQSTQSQTPASGHTSARSSSSQITTTSSGNTSVSGQYRKPINENVKKAAEQYLRNGLTSPTKKVYIPQGLGSQNLPGFRSNNTQTIQINGQNFPIASGRIVVRKETYSELWDDCEVLIDALDEAGIDHDGLYYPMDYYELRDLRDELLSTADDNDVEW